MNLRGWKTAASLAGCALALSACQTLKPKAPPHLDVPDQPAAPVAVAPPPAPPATRVVEVPVKQVCVPRTFPKAPKYPDTDQALREAGGAADRYQLLAAGRVLREHRLAELEKMIDGCR